MIQINNLCKSFGDKQVIDNVNLKIEDGKVFGLVGINGAGKSTLLRLLSGIYEADSGSIMIEGENVFENEKVKSKIFFLPDEPFYDYNTSPMNLIDIYKTYYNFDEDKYIKYLNEFKLPFKKTMHNFSKGMKRQVFISLALAIKPSYLFLDEAFDGLDPLARLSVKRAIVNLVSEYNTTIIISSHSLRELQDICDSYALIDKMQIASYGDINDAIEKIHKYQIAFDYIPKEEDFDIEFISYKQDSRIIKVVVKEDFEEFSEKMKKYNPLLIDEVSIDFEELFIIEVESRGYINEKDN